MNVKEIELGLLVSDCGRVFKEARYTDRGNTRIKYKCITYKGVRTDVHRLVAKGFIENINNKPCVLHNDDDPRNNRLKNLRWGTHKENSEDAVKRHRCGPYKLEIRNIVIYMVKNGYQFKEIAKEIGVSLSRVSQIIKWLENKKLL